MFKRKETWLVIFGLPTAYMLMTWALFGVRAWNEVFVVMSLAFPFLVPTVTGAW